MVVYEKKTKKGRDTIIDTAEKFFGPDGLGLDMTDKQSCCVSFEGGGGYVNVAITDEGEKETTCEIESREWDHPAKRFVSSL